MIIIFLNYFDFYEMKGLLVLEYVEESFFINLIVFIFKEFLIFFKPFFLLNLFINSFKFVCFWLFRVTLKINYKNIFDNHF